MSPAGSGHEAPRHVRVAVVGAGFSGLATAGRLRLRGETSLVVLERADEVGGTWRDNTYPGAACDIRSDLYSLSFAPHPGWTSLFAGQAEIKAYLERTVDDLGLRPYLRLGTEVRAASWDEDAALWRLRTDRGAWTAEVLVCAAGPLVQPRWPAIPGLESFTGPRVHSAAWDDDVDLTGVRVGVIGTGASAVQLVPHVARHDRGTSARRRAVFARAPWLQRLSRERVFRRNDLTHLALAHAWLGRRVERSVLASMYRRVHDPDLRRALTPDYRLGCKRILVSDDYYPALTRDDVDLVTDAVTAVTPTGVTTADGTEHALDVLVCSTGFVATDPPVSHLVRGRDGRTLAQHWAGTGMQALRGTTVTGFPNFFYLVGPNTALGHNSVVEVIETQVSWLLQALDRAGAGLRPGERAVLEPTAAAQRAWTARVRADLAGSVWVTGGCTSFYLDDQGRNTTLWPRRAAAFRRALRRFDPAEHHRRVVAADGSVPRPATAGVGRAAVHVP